MIPVSDIWEDAKKIVGKVSETTLLRRITDAVELLANKGDFDPLAGFVDICADNCLVTLPREVETIYGVNIAGVPAVGRDELFRFHLNGPGDCGVGLTWEWTDLRETCTYRELVCPSKLIAFCQRLEDENSEFWVEGWDENGNVLRTEVSDGVWRNGIKVPVFVDQQALPDDTQTIARIKPGGIRKAVTAGAIRLLTLEGSDQTGQLLGVYQWDEVAPAFRRIKVSQNCGWVRIAYRKRTFALRSQDDLIPLHNSMAVILMLKAIKRYLDPDGLAEAEGLESTAVRWLGEEQRTRAPVVAHPMVVQGQGLMDPEDLFVH